MPEISENLVEFYYEKLNNDTNPGKLIAEFFCKVHGKPLTKSEIIMFNKLIRLFGRYTAFFSVMDSANMEDRGTAYPLLYTICKNRFEKSHVDVSSSAHILIDRDIRKLWDEVEALRDQELNIPDVKDI
jgi:hypothetical protein